MTQLALLAQELGVSERTLRRAVNQGALRATRPTPKILRMALSEQQYVRRSWPLLGRLRKVLRTEQNVRFALLFGSAATGMDTPSSDVDVLVVLRDTGLERVIDLNTKLAATLGRPVDVVQLKDAEGDILFLAEALADGRVLVDREGLWPRLRSRAASLRRRAGHQEAKRVEAALSGIDRLLAA